MTKPLLQVEDLRITFGTKTVVDGVAFSIAPGEKLGLVGESGSGKTVTVLSLLKLLQHASVQGRALFQGAQGERDLLTMGEREMCALRGDEIAMIFQEPMTALNPLMAVGAQIAEAVRAKRAVSRSQAAEAAIALLERTGIPQPRERARMFPHQLSGGQRQRAMIAMALACNPRLLLADEPTTALDATLRVQILDLLDELRRESGLAILMITHDLNLVHRFADRVAVMQQGRLVEQGVVERIFSAPQDPYTQKLLASRPERRVAAAAGGGKPVLAASDLRVTYPVPIKGVRGWFRKGEFVALQGASFAVSPGQTLGVIGESGSGKSTLAQAVLALLPRRQVQGSIQVVQDHWRFRAAADRPLRRCVQVVFQDPFSSLSPRFTVGEIVGEGLRVHEPGLDAEQRRERVWQALTEVGLDAAQFPRLLARYPHEFSGGQRQRIALARALIVQPELVVLDEPTSALDVTIQKQVLSLLQELQRRRGLSYLLITHDVDVVRAMAHQLMVLKDGVVVESGPALHVLDAPQHPYTRELLAAA